MSEDMFPKTFENVESVTFDTVSSGEAEITITLENGDSFYTYQKYIDPMWEQLADQGYIDYHEDGVEWSDDA